MNVHGKKILITGTRKGIGLALATAFAENNCELHLVQRSFDPEQEAELKERGAKSVHLWQCDLSIFSATQELCEKLKDLNFDIVVNNAGLLTGDLIEKQDPVEIEKMFQVNLISAVLLTRAVLPRMIARGEGKIVQNSSVSAIMRFPCASTYAASKAGLLAFSECLQVELEGTGVGVLTLLTPGIKTEMFDQIADKYGRYIETPQNFISASDYAKQVIEHIEADKSLLTPDGKEKVGLFLSKYLPGVFRWGVLKGFHREATQVAKEDKK